MLSPLVLLQQCGNDYAYGPSWISDMMLCANVPGGGKDACQVRNSNLTVLSTELCRATPAARWS